MSRATAERTHRPWPFLWVLAIALLDGQGVEAEEGIVLTPREAWSSVFGATPVDFHFVVKGANRPRLHAGWAFTIGRRTVAAGEAEIMPGPDAISAVAIHLDVPPVKDGVVLPAMLTVTISEGAGGKAVALREKPLWIFPRDPFADRTRWLKGLGLTLFDPANTTAEAFEKMGIPFEPARDVDAVDALKEGTLVIGEGVSFAENRGLAEALAALAERGVPILCLAPSDGVILLPNAGEARSITLRHADVISAFDKRLDSEGWPGVGEFISSGLVLKAEGERPVGEIAAGRVGWPWLEVGYPGRKGRLVVCGFGLMSHWEDGPTPRFLLARMLEFVVGSDEESERPGPLPEPEGE